ncbi:MAG TPA: hypothetical protein VGJ60_07100 [Chloroflexota bacterium]|jgi:predicted amidophosphoribosyltransferase
MARKNDRVGGKISRGTCEGCGLDLGNRLDPYCWACAKQLERVIEQRMRERRRELAEQAAS